MIITVNVEVGIFQIQSLDVQIKRGVETLAAELFKLFSKPEVLKYHPEIKIRSEQDALAFIRQAVLDFYAKKKFLHFLISKTTYRIIGLIDVTVGGSLEDDGQTTNVLIDFYCDVYLRRKLSATDILLSFFNDFETQGVDKLSAIVSRRDISAKKMIKAMGFVLDSRHDQLSDLYYYHGHKKAGA